MTQTKLLLAFTVVLLFAVSLRSVNGQSGEIIPGGVSPQDRPVDNEIQQLVKLIHPQIEAHFVGLPGYRNTVTKFKPISYRTQLVNGVNYFVKVGAKTPNKTVYYHIRVYKSFGGKPQLIKVEGPKLRDDPINYF